MKKLLAITLIMITIFVAACGSPILSPEKPSTEETLDLLPPPTTISEITEPMSTDATIPESSVTVTEEDVQSSDPTNKPTTITKASSTKKNADKPSTTKATTTIKTTTTKPTTKTTTTTTTTKKNTTTTEPSTTTTTTTSIKTTETKGVSVEDQNALRKAEQYLDLMPFSKIGLYNQLLFEKYSKEAAQYAVDNVKVDWKKEALKKQKTISMLWHSQKKDCMDNWFLKSSSQMKLGMR